MIYFEVPFLVRSNVYTRYRLPVLYRVPQSTRGYLLLYSLLLSLQVTIKTNFLAELKLLLYPSNKAGHCCAEVVYNAPILK